MRSALAQVGEWTIEVVNRFNTAKALEVLPRRWAVERAFAWLGRYRRLTGDLKKSFGSAEA